MVLVDAVLIAVVVDGVLRPEAVAGTGGVLCPDVPVVGVLWPVVGVPAELAVCSKKFLIIYKYT